MAKRSRGGQPGNKNALKHGFYSAYFRKAEKRDFENGSMGDGLESEIMLLRAVIRRIARSTLPHVDKQMSDEILRQTHTLLAAAKTLATLKRTQAILTRGLSDVEMAIYQALDDLDHE